MGAWASLWAFCAKDECGNVTRGDVILEDRRGTLVHADSRLVTVLGADDLVVVETADEVLVACSTPSIAGSASRPRAYPGRLFVARPREKAMGKDRGARCPETYL